MRSDAGHTWTHPNACIPRSTLRPRLHSQTTRPCQPATLADQVKRILDMAERAASRWEVSYSNFVSPAILQDTLAAIQAPDVVAIAWGGYAQAERCRYCAWRS